MISHMQAWSDHGLIDHENGASVSAQVADVIRRQIIDGTLPRGTPLPPERDLADQLGVARSAVREALRELRAQGFLAADRSRKRTVIASMAETGIVDPLAQLLESGADKYLELIELRQGLEVQAAGLAARRRQSDDLAALAEIVADMQGQHDKDGNADLDAAFHGAVAQATHNVFFAHVTGELVGLLHDHIPAILDILYSEPSSGHELAEQHGRIFAAIDRNDEEGARRAMMDHLSYVVSGIGRLKPTLEGKGAPVGPGRPVARAIEPTPVREPAARREPAAIGEPAARREPAAGASGGLDRDLVD